MSLLSIRYTKTSFLLTTGIFHSQLKNAGLLVACIELMMVAGIPYNPASLSLIQYLISSSRGQHTSAVNDI